MSSHEGRDDQVIRAQRDSHGAGHDYLAGSPHLRHPPLRGMVETRLRDVVRMVLAEKGSCHAVEVGAGHGTFTHVLLDAGADVVTTETSAASAAHLRREFAGNERLRVLDDETGEMVFDLDERWDLAVVISVLHHIPDYLGFMTRLTDAVTEGGALFTAQDPLFYPRRPWTRRADLAAFLAWRTFQGNYKQGIATRLRRVRGVYDETAPSDLVEYHVWREGMDEEAIEQLLRSRFDEVEIFPYWSTQAPWLQRLGSRTRMVTDFGVTATGRKSS